MTIRLATVDDIPVIMQIRFSVRENVLSDPAKVTAAMCIDYLDRLGRGWVCEQAGKIIGFSYAARADGSIWALFVLPEHEGQGAGKQLLKAATDWLFHEGHSQVVLSTTINTRADRFYATQGWQRGAMKDDVEVFYRLNRSEG